MINCKQNLQAMSSTNWMTPGGLFSVQSGWSMLSTRIRPGLFNDVKGFDRIRRLLLDLARGPAEVSTGLQGQYRYEASDSNRLDPYQVGITILSAYANSPLGIFSQFNEKWNHVSFADCIHACAMESRLFYPTKKQSKMAATKDAHGISENQHNFMKYVLEILVFIRDHPNSKTDHVDLSNRLLSFCSIARISPARDNESSVEKLIKSFFHRKGRLIHISLKDVHKAAKYLCLNQRLKWGWSVVVTVCFEKAIDAAYQNTIQIFGGEAWLLSRTPGRALFFQSSKNLKLELEKEFVNKFNEIFINIMSGYCKVIDTSESRKIQQELVTSDEISIISSKLIKLSYTQGTQKTMFNLFIGSSKYTTRSREDNEWGKNSESPTWVNCLDYPAARGLRRFRSIQSLWQDLIDLRGRKVTQKTRPHRDSDSKSFVYLDCIQLGDLLWKNDDNWLQCFENARILAPIIEGTLAAFISAFDTLYPEFDKDRMLFGPKALGGDELHIIVPLSMKEVKRVANELDKKLWKHLKQYGLASSSEWVIPKKNKTGRLVLKNKNESVPVFPRQMWWFGVVELPDDEDEIQQLINDFSGNITEMKRFIRERWKGSKSLFHPM